MLGYFQRQKAHHYFELLDQDEDGYINGEDFRMQADSLAEERNLTEDEHEALREQMLGWWKQLCASADADDDDRVSQKEWEEFWDAIQSNVEEGTDEEKARVLKSLEHSGEVTFQTINASGSGEITEEEYAQWLSAWNASGSSKAFGELDRSGNGTLSKDEIVEATKEFYLSDDANAPGNLLYGTLS